MDVFELGELVRQTRKANKLTQQELAESVGLSRHTILQLESGQISDLGIRKVLAILCRLGLEANFQPIQRRWPTLEEAYARNQAEEEALRRRVTGRD